MNWLMVSSSLLRLLLRCRSPFAEVRRSALEELGAIDVDAMSLADLGALVTFIPDLIETCGPDAGRLVLCVLQCDLGGLSSARFERIYPYVPSELGPLIVGVLARQRRPESWLALRRVLHLELIQPQHCTPEPNMIEPLGEVCHEPTFALESILEAVDDPLWTTQAVGVLITWCERGLLSDPDLARCRQRVPVLDELFAVGTSG